MPANKGAGPAVTVIIATYNKCGLLRYAIASVLRQTFQDFEVRVVGDGCTDDSEAVVASFDDSRLLWSNLPTNSGYQSAPTNKALAEARGRTIAYLNHDDMWTPHHLERMVATLDESQAEFAYAIEAVFTAWAPPFPRIPDYPDMARPPEASSTMHRREVVDQIGFWKQRQETYFTPRADYFRRAQAAGMRFQLSPYLTSFKIGTLLGSYAAYETSLHEQIARNLAEDPLFVEGVLAGMLVQADNELKHVITPNRLRSQLAEVVRVRLARRGIEPSRLRFWRGKGDYVREWHRKHGIETTTAE